MENMSFSFGKALVHVIEGQSLDIVGSHILGAISDVPGATTSRVLDGARIISVDCPGLEFEDIKRKLLSCDKLQGVNVFPDEPCEVAD